MLVSLQYPLLRAQVPVPSYIHAWILGHPRLGNALYNTVRPTSEPGLTCDLISLRTVVMFCRARGFPWRVLISSLSVHLVAQTRGICDSVRSEPISQVCLASK